MGQSSVETVGEIEGLRGRLEEEIRELENRMPRPARWVKRAVGMAVAGGGLWLTVWRLTRRRRRRRERGRIATDGEARGPTTVIQVLPERWAERLDDRWVQAAVAAAAGLWLVLRMAEVRQLRRMNRTLSVR